MPLNGILPLAALQSETIWLDAGRYQDAERRYHEISTPENLNAARPQQSLMQKKSNSTTGSQQSTSTATPSSSLATEIAQARQKIQNFLKSGDYESDFNKNILNRLQILEEEKERMGQRLNEMHNLINTVMKQIAELDLTPISKTKVDQHKKQDKPSVNGPSATAVSNDEEDDDVDLFGSDEETEEDIKLKQERVKAYENKKSKKPALVAKSSVVLDVKPWSDETDMKELEIGVRKIKLDGLNWGASKLVPLAYGIKKLQIIAIVEDEKVSIDGLQESIEELDDLVQSVDIAAFNKL